MIISKSVDVTRVEQIQLGKMCNGCGNIFEPYDEQVKSFESQIGYNVTWKYELCSTCILGIIKTFAIVPENFMSDSNFTSSFDLDHDLHQKLFVEWQETNIWNCDENPWQDYYSEDNSDQESEIYEEYNEEISDALEVRNPLHINVVRLATIHKIGLAKRWCENND